MRVTRAVVPSLFTVLNMFCGFMAVIHSSRTEYEAACWFIVLAAVFDSLDGMMARITKSASQFGVEIDSLSDVVSFGVAPAFMVYKLALHQLGGFGILLSSLLMVFGGLRLARFNVQLVGFDKEYFSGLPIPVSAITIAAFVLKYYNAVNGLDPGAAAWLPWIVVVLSLLMVSKVKYDTMPKPSRRAIRRHPWKYAVFLVGAGIALFTKGDAIFLLFVIFIGYGIVRQGVESIRRFKGRMHSSKFDDDAVEPTHAEP